MVVTIVIIVFYWFMIDIMLSLATSMGNNAVVTTQAAQPIFTHCKNESPTRLFFSNPRQKRKNGTLFLFLSIKLSQKPFLGRAYKVN